MGLIDVKYVRAENLTATEKAELGIDSSEGLVAIEITNPDLKHKGKLVTDYVEHLLSLGDTKK